MKIRNKKKALRKKIAFNKKQIRNPVRMFFPNGQSTLGSFERFFGQPDTSKTVERFFNIPPIGASTHAE